MEKEDGTCLPILSVENDTAKSLFIQQKKKKGQRGITEVWQKCEVNTNIMVFCGFFMVFVIYVSFLKFSNLLPFFLISKNIHILT